MRVSIFACSFVFSVLAACSDGGKSNNNNNQRDPVTLEQYDANMAQWRCRMYIDCCEETQMLLGLQDQYADYESCLAGETGAIVADAQNTLTRELNEELITDAWYAHLDYYGTGCATVADVDHRAAYDDLMDRLYTGLAGENEECWSSDDCEAGLWCDYYSQRCAPLPLEDESCTETGCGVGLACVDGTCLESRAAGETCRDNLYAPCPDKHESLTCDLESNTCVLKYTVGSPCTTSRQCRSQLCGNDGLCVAGGPTMTNEEEWCMDWDPF